MTASSPDDRLWLARVEVGGSTLYKLYPALTAEAAAELCSGELVPILREAGPDAALDVHFSDLTDQARAAGWRPDRGPPVP